MFTSAEYVLEALRANRCNGRAGGRGECTIHSSRSKGKLEVSLTWRSESFGETGSVVFSIEQANLIKSSVFRHANPSNLRGSLFEGNKDYFFYLPTRTQKQRAAHFSIGASVRTDEFFWWFWSLEDVESNCSWRLSHVSSQLAMIWSSRALLSRDKRLPLDTWNQPGLQENVLGNQFSTCDHLQIFLREIQSDDVHRNRKALLWSRKEEH